jgi:putative restriction endonuclease
MTAPLENVLQKISRLRTYQRGERRAPHKPLLLLIAIGERIRGKEKLAYGEVEKALMPLLKAFAPPVQNRPQPELPYWHLVSDGLWTVEGADALPRQAGGFPRIGALRQTHGGLDSELATVVTTDPIGTELIIERLLEEYFPPTIQEDIMAAVGIERPAQRMMRDAPLATAAIRYRNPRFREDVLRAYEHQCAATGFRAALGGSYFGCEAAHVRWHAYDGPDDVGCATGGLTKIRPTDTKCGRLPVVPKAQDNGAIAIPSTTSCVKWRRATWCSLSPKHASRPSGSRALTVMRLQSLLSLDRREPTGKKLAGALTSASMS